MDIVIPSGLSSWSSKRSAIWTLAGSYGTATTNAHPGAHYRLVLTAWDLSGRVIGRVIRVHKAVGPGRLEPVYEDCLCHEITLNGLRFQRQVELSLIYDGA